MKRNAKSRTAPAESEPDEMDQVEPSREKPPAFSDNPIIAEIERSLWRSNLRFTGYTAAKLQNYIPAGTDAETRHQLIQRRRDFIRKLWGEPTLVELGLQLAEALLLADRDFTKTVKHALKESDRLFNRNRVLPKLDQCFAYVSSLGPLADPPSRRDFEKHCNKGKPLHEHEWRDIRKTFLLPHSPGGRPKKPRHGKRKSVS
jgi:hypothetical protein